MKKSHVKCLALLGIATCALVGGAFAINPTTQKASAEVTYTGTTLSIESFEMVPGAAVRIGASENQNGIRFSATMSPADYNSLQEKFAEGEIETGTLIMPYTYYKNVPFSYDSCFDATPTYVWGDTTKTEGQYKIQHLEGALYATQDEAGNDVYQLNGSIVKLLDENLDVELVGVSYVKATLGGNTYYAFAESDFDVNKRSIVNVSQNGLEEDGETGSDASTLIGYINRYLTYYADNNDGANPIATYNKDVYVKTSKGWEKDAELSQTAEAELSAYNTVVESEAPTLEGYTYCNGLAKDGYGDGKVSGLLKLDGSTTLKYYFEETRDNLLWDIENHRNATLTAHGTDYSTTYISEGSSFDKGWIKSYNDFAYQGERSLWMKSMDWASWLDITFPEAVSIPTTNQLSMIITNLTGTDFEDFRVIVVTSSGNVNASADGTSTGANQFTIPGTAKAQKFTFDFQSSFDTVKTIRIFQPADTNWSIQLLIENICFEKDFYINETAKNIEVATAEQSTVEINPRDIIGSTLYTKKEIQSGASMTLKYTDLSKPVAQQSSVSVSKDAEGDYTIPVAKNNNYSYTCDITMAGQNYNQTGYILGYFDCVYATFEADSSFASGYHGLYGDDWGTVELDKTFTFDNPYGTHAGVDVINSPNVHNNLNGLTKKYGAIDGDTAMFLNWASDWSSHGGCRGDIADSKVWKDEGGNPIKVNTVCMFIYNPFSEPIAASSVGQSLHVFSIAQEGASTTGYLNAQFKNYSETYQPGWNYVEMTLSEEFVGVNGFSLYNGTGSNGCVQIAVDRVTFKYVA